MFNFKKRRSRNSSGNETIDEDRKQETPKTKYKIRKSTRKKDTRAAFNSDPENLHHNVHLPYDHIRTTEVQQRDYNGIHGGGDQMNSSNNSLDRRSLRNGDTANSISRSRSVNTADYFTIFSNNANSNSNNRSFTNLSQPNSWTMSLDRSNGRRRRQRYDSASSIGQSNELDPMDGNTFMIPSHGSGSTPSPNDSSESIGDQQVRHNRGYIAAFKVNRGRSPSPRDSSESIGDQQVRHNRGYIAAFKRSRDTLRSSSSQIEECLDTSREELESVPYSPTGELTSEDRVAMQAKLLSLEMRWAKLQWECEGRNVRLQTIYLLLQNYEKQVEPFMCPWLRYRSSSLEMI